MRHLHMCLLATREATSQHSCENNKLSCCLPLLNIAVWQAVFVVVCETAHYL